MSPKISKKFLIVLSAFAAVVLLSSWLIVSGTAKSVIRTVKNEVEVLLNPPAEPDFPLLDDLKPGKYLLQREWGLDETEYIEVFEDHTLQFSGEYWVKRRAENIEQLADYYDTCTDVTERNPYELIETAPIVTFGSYGNSFSYLDENTFICTRTRDEKDDVTDYEYSLNKDPKWVDAYYIYAEQ